MSLPETMPQPEQSTTARCFRYALKFAMWSAGVLGTLSFLYVAWDARDFLLTGRVPVDDPMYVLLTITILGVLAGAAGGAVLGIGIGVLQSRAR